MLSCNLGFSGPTELSLLSAVFFFLLAVLTSSQNRDCKCDFCDLSQTQTATAWWGGLSLRPPRGSAYQKPAVGASKRLALYSPHRFSIHWQTLPDDRAVTHESCYYRAFAGAQRGGCGTRHHSVTFCVPLTLPGPLSSTGRQSGSEEAALGLL